MRIALGLLLLAGAGLAAWYAVRSWQLWRVLVRTEVTTPDRLLDTVRAGPQIRLVTGTAGPGRQGSLVSTVNAEPCVWHRHTVKHHQVRYRTDAKGRSRRSSSRRRVGDVRSREPFRVGHLEVQPDQMVVDRPERRRSRILPGIASQPLPDAAALTSGGSIQNTYHHREWIIRAGTPLHILGEVTDRGATVVMRRPSRGPHFISTRTADAWLRRSRVVTIGATALAVAAGGCGIILLASY
jgi:hypothetical protein